MPIILKNQKGSIHVLALIVLVVGIVAGVYLVQKTQIFKPKANEPSATIFNTDHLIRTTEDFPLGVFVSLCLNDGQNVAGIWQVTENLRVAKYLYPQWEDRCAEDHSNKLVFSQDTPVGAYIKLCMTGKQEAWIWQVDETRRKTNYLGSAEDTQCQSGGDETAIPAGVHLQLRLLEPALVDLLKKPEVANTETSGVCKNGPELTWEWNLNNASSVITWVWAGQSPIYKSSKPGSFGELTLTAKDGIVSNSTYALQIKAANEAGEESDITTVILTAPDCTAHIQQAQNNTVDNTDPEHLIDRLLQFKFTRGGQKLTMKSRTLAQYFVDAGRTLGIPPAVLAGLAAHESPVFFDNAKDSHTAFCDFTTPECPGYDLVNKSTCEKHFAQSIAGARGIMQLTKSADNDIAEAAAFLDHPTVVCDPKDNIYAGALHLAKKVGINLPSQYSQWDYTTVSKAVCRYYGACNFGRFNYGDEVASDYQEFTNSF